MNYFCERNVIFCAKLNCPNDGFQVLILHESCELEVSLCRRYTNLKPNINFTSEEEKNSSVESLVFQNFWRSHHIVNLWCKVNNVLILLSSTHLLPKVCPINSWIPIPICTHSEQRNVSQNQVEFTFYFIHPFWQGLCVPFFWVCFLFFVCNLSAASKIPIVEFEIHFRGV